MAEERIEHPPARLMLFGFRPIAAKVGVIGRPKSWRVKKAFTALGLGLVAAPVLAFVPPHFPWPPIALGVGIYQFFRYWTQARTLVSMEGACPKCGAPQAAKLPTKLTGSMILSCPGCHHDVELIVEDQAMEGAAD